MRRLLRLLSLPVAAFALACGNAPPAATTPDAGTTTDPSLRACAKTADCEPWESCEGGLCTPVKCVRDTECAEGQLCRNGECSRARAEFCVQTGLPPPNDCSRELALDFGAVRLHETMAIGVRLVNTGNVALNVAAIDLVNTPAQNDFSRALSAEGAGPWSVAPGKDLVATVSYTPSDAVEDVGELRVVTDDPSALQTRIPILSFIKCCVKAGATPNALDFGYVPTHETKALELAVTNDGTFGTNSVLEVKSIEPGHPAYHVSPRATLPHHLAVGEKLVVDVTYAPAVDENNESAITIRTNDATTPALVVPATGFSNASLLFITTNPALEATATRAWSYTAKLVDGTYAGPDWTWNLAEAPAGMTVTGDLMDGKLAWTPGADQVGPHHVALEVTNPRGGKARQEFDVEVIGLFTLARATPMVASACGGTELVLEGTNLHPDSRVRFRAQAGAMPEADAAVSLGTDGKLRTTVPPLPSGGWFHLEIVSNADETNASTLENALLSLAEVTGATPTDAALDQNINLTGCGLLGVRRAMGMAAPDGGRLPIEWKEVSATEGQIRFPSVGSVNWASGTIELVSLDGTPSRRWPVTLAGRPKVLDIARIQPVAPTSGGVARVEIYGSGFDAVPANNLVQFSAPNGASPVAPTIGTGTAVTAIVPADALTGPISIAAGIAGQGTVTRSSDRAYVVPGSTAVKTLLAVSHPNFNENLPRMALFGSGFGSDPARLAVKITAADRSQHDLPVLWASDTTLMVDGSFFANMPVGPATISLFLDGQEIGEGLPVLRSQDGGNAVAHAGDLPPPSGDGLPPLQATLYSSLGGIATVDGAIVYVDSDRIRLYNQLGTHAGANFYGKNVGAGSVGTIFTNASDVFISAIAIEPDTKALWVSTMSTLFKLDYATGARTDVIANGSQGNNTGPLADATVLFPSTIVPIGGRLVYLDDGRNAQGIRLINLSNQAVTRHGVTVPPGHVRQVSPRTFVGTFLSDIAVSAAGDLYLASDNVELLRRDSSTFERVVSTWGDLVPPGASDVPAGTVALGGRANGIAIGPNGNVYVGTTAGIVRRIKVNPATGRVDSGSLIDTIAGDPLNLGYHGDGGPATSASLRPQISPGIDAEGNLLVQDGCRIRKVVLASAAADRIISTLVGNGCFRPSDNSPGSIPRAYEPEVGALSHSQLELYTFERQNGVVWISNLDGTRAVEVEDVVGLAEVGGKVYARQGRTPRIVAFDPSVPSPTPVAVAGTGVHGHTGDGGPALSATFMAAGSGRFVRLLSEAAHGLVAIADDDRVRVFNPTNAPITAYGKTIAPGNIERVAGGVTGNWDELGTDHQLQGILSIVMHPNGDLVMAEDIAPGRVLELSAADGTIRAIIGPQVPEAAPAGGWKLGFPRHGQQASAARINGPRVTAIDGAGNLYLVDGRITSSGLVLPAGVVDTYDDGPLLPNPVAESFLFGIGQGYFFSATSPVVAYPGAP